MFLLFVLNLTRTGRLYSHVCHLQRLRVLRLESRLVVFETLVHMLLSISLDSRFPRSYLFLFITLSCVNYIMNE